MLLVGGTMKDAINRYSASYLNDLLEVVQALSGFETDIKNCNILITGGTGFLGRWLVDVLLLMGANVSVVSRSPEKSLSNVEHWRNAPGISWIQSDLKSLPQVRGGMDVVIHAANDLNYTANEALEAAKMVFDAAEVSKASKVLFLSSGAVYSAAGQLNPYGQAKIWIENEGLKRASEGRFDFRIARCFSFLGPLQDLNAHFAATQFFRALIEGRPILIQGDGSPVRSFLYPVDFCCAIIRILMLGESGQCYDVGSHERVSIRELAERINRYRDGVIPPIETLGQKGASLSQSNVYAPACENRCDVQGVPKIKLDEAIFRTARFYRETFPNSIIRA